MKLMIPEPHKLVNGLVIIFEGIDGVGKTTQLELMQKALQDAGWPVMPTRNLGGTPIGEELRKVIKQASLERPALTDFYVSLAIQEPLLEIIDKARTEGKIVLMDRGPLSLAAYQIYGGGVDPAVGWPHVESGMTRIKPEAVILYDMDPEAARQRLPAGKTDYFESKPNEYFQKVAAGFREAAGRYSASSVIDADQPVEAVSEQTLAVIAALLNK